MDPMPIITLTTGLRVANFSSPHSFRFTDGSELPACSPERANGCMLNSREVVLERGGWNDIDLEFTLSQEAANMLIDALETWSLFHTGREGEVDLIIVPFPVLTCLKRLPPSEQTRLGFDMSSPLGHPFRTIRSADRVTKVVHHDRFCF